MADDELKSDLLDRISSAPLSERGIADAMAKWSAEELQSMVEVVAPDDDRGSSDAVIAKSQTGYTQSARRV